jgi:hypothetical protein
MAESDTIAVWVVDDTEHQVLDEFVSTREAVEQRIEEICGGRHMGLSADSNSLNVPAVER